MNKLDLFGNSTAEVNYFVYTVLESSCTGVYTPVLRSLSPRTSLSAASLLRGLLYKYLFGFILFSLVQVLEANNPGSIDVDVKDSTFNVSLAANPTTGFQWQVLDYNKELITLDASYFKKGSGQLIGSGGTMVFSFTLNKVKIFPKQTIIVFKYSRPWEHKRGSLREVLINFRNSK